MNKKEEQLFEKYYDNAEAIAQGETVDLPAYLAESYQGTSLGSSEAKNAMEMLMAEAQQMTTKENENENEEGEVPDGH